MSAKSAVRLLSAVLLVLGAVLALDTAGLSPATRASASVVSDWKNSDATAVAVGFDHTCAIETGVLYCWGGGTYGQLGYLEPRVGFRIPPPTDQSKAVKVASVPVAGFTNTSVSGVVAGYYTTCAIENRMAFCWGGNFNGQLGNGRVETQRDTAVKVSAANGFTNTNVTAISHSGNNGCVLEGGKVYCWGSNNGGSVGDGTLVNKTVPQLVVSSATMGDFVNDGNVTAIAAGNTSCAVRLGVLFCWGSGRFGQMGNGTTTTENPRPVRVSSVSGGFQNSNVVSVSVTGLDVCATRLENGNPVMYCWGAGGTGNHGAGDTQSNVTRPRKVAPVAGGFTNTQVTSSHVGKASCAVNAGVVYCFGTNLQGQVGDGTTRNSRPLATRVLPSNGLLNAGAVTMVATRYDHSCAIENRVVFCWGQAFNGRLGNGQTSGIYSSAVSAASLPGAPVISGATAGTTTATVTVSAGPGGVPTSYTVTASAQGQPTLTCTVTAPATSCDFEGLAPNTSYTFTATATSDQGTSPPSAPVQRTTGPLDPPLAPSLVPGDGQLQVTINPATTGGTPTGYIAYASPGGGSCTVLSPATSCTISPLTNGTTYTVTTSAFNDDGPSAASPSTSAVPGPPDPPLAPVLEVGDGSLTVTVSPAPTGGTASHYNVFVQPGGRTCTVTPPATSCVISGLTNGVTYSSRPPPPTLWACRLPLLQPRWWTYFRCHCGHG
jgi:alpha-tubulin suppressor-like RCC1 family protein